MTAVPELQEFRLEFPGNGLVHVVFDAPGRTMNVFSEAAIVEIGRIARWLEEADVGGALIGSVDCKSCCCDEFNACDGDPACQPYIACSRQCQTTDPLGVTCFV